MKKKFSDNPILVKYSYRWSAPTESVLHPVMGEVMEVLFHFPFIPLPRGTFLLPEWVSLDLSQPCCWCKTEKSRGTGGEREWGQDPRVFWGCQIPSPISPPACPLSTQQHWSSCLSANMGMPIGVPLSALSMQHSHNPDMLMLHDP